MRKALAGALLLGVILVSLVALAGPVRAAGAVASWSERQVLPGITERTIWGRDQVYVYRLPQNVTHTGDLHVELKLRAGRRRLLRLRPGPGGEGVPRVAGLPRDLRAGLPGAVAGPRGRRLRGARGPRRRPAWTRACAATPTTWSCRPPAPSPGSGSRATCRAPSRGARTPRRRRPSRAPRSRRPPARAPRSPSPGRRTAAPFDLTPTSQGQAECRLEYPADAAKRTVTRRPPPRCRRASSSTSTRRSGSRCRERSRSASRPTTPTGTCSIRTATPPRRSPAPTGTACRVPSPSRPPVRGNRRRSYHYVPVLWLAAVMPYAVAPAPPSPPATGLQHGGVQGHAADPAEPAAAPARRRRSGRAGARPSRARSRCPPTARPARASRGRRPARS